MALQKFIEKFEPITLEEMESVKLMDRVDTKYVFPFSQLPHILDEMKSYYRLLDINNIRMHRYESLYYDTNDFQLYAKHQSGRLNRYKLRFRKYVDSNGLTFFEIKFKNNKGRTIKDISDEIKKHLTKYFKPELVNRFSDIIIFKSLSPQDILQITKLQLQNISKNIRAEIANVRVVIDRGSAGVNLSLFFLDWLEFF